MKFNNPLHLHGALYSYQQGCRCEKCLAANREYNQQYRKLIKGTEREKLYIQKRVQYKRDHYNGVCVDCGSKTIGCAPTLIPDLCRVCTDRRRGEQLRGSGKYAPQIIALLTEHETMKTAEITDHFGVSNKVLGNVLSKMVGWGMIERVRYGVYSLPKNGT